MFNDFAIADIGNSCFCIGALLDGGREFIPAFDRLIVEVRNFVARSFAGDPKQLVNLLKASLGHRGTALFDIISPCVTFNNHDSSTKSFGYGKAHEERIQDVTFVPSYEEVTVDYEPGEERIVKLTADKKFDAKKSKPLGLPKTLVGKA